MRISGVTGRDSTVFGGGEAIEPRPTVAAYTTVHTTLQIGVTIEHNIFRTYLRRHRGHVRRQRIEQGSSGVSGRCRSGIGIFVEQRIEGVPSGNRGGLQTIPVASICVRSDKGYLDG